MKKAISLLINILAAIVAIATLCIIQIKFPQNNIISIISSPVYEMTDNFYNLVNERINNIFTLINYKIPFEHNETLSYDKTIAESIDINGVIKSWNISDCLDLAKEHGLYIDTQYNVSKLEGSTTPFNPNMSYNFLLKTYPSKIKNGAQSEENFINEIMDALAKYYKTNNNLKDKNSNFYYNISFIDNATKDVIEYKNCNYTNEQFLDSRAFIFLSSKDNIISSNIGYISQNTMKKAKSQNPYLDKEMKLYCSIDTTFQKDDEFRLEYIKYNELKQTSGLLIIICIAAMIFFIISLFFCMYYIFSAKRSIDDSQKFLFTIPTEFHFLLYIVATIGLIVLANKISISHFISENELPTIRLYAYVLTIYITTLIFFFILSAKFANGSLFFALVKIKNTEKDDTLLSLPPAATLFIMFIPIIIFTVIAFYSIYLFTLTAYKPALYIGILILFATFGFVIYLLLLHNAFNKSIETQKKSNEMRTSLIANVSHDIKTPLTSIINYTNLISEEVLKPSKNFNKNLTHYSEVVIDKANRLNDLINELIFESKVSTGNVQLDMQKLDVVAFLIQVINEFKEKLKTLGIKVVYDHNEEQTFITADSKQLYRVFQNLFSNLYKYALEKSRVYIDVMSDKNKVVITIKNIEREKLEVDVDTLKERFVRGNKSRTTEGFGLGLSISESLVKSMNGQLTIKNIRDEFITSIKFIKYND